MSAAIPRPDSVSRLRVAVTSATGLVGSALVPALRAAGHRVDRLSRRPPEAGTTDIQWDPAGGWLDPRALEGADAVVHLAGESIAAGRWTAAIKERVRRDAWAFVRFLWDRDLLARLAARRRALVEETETLARLLPAEVLTGGAGPGDTER